MTLLITMFTDAGLCPDTKAASWAAWAKCDGRTMRRAGVLKGDYDDCNAAEIAAILNGMSALRCFADMSLGARVIIQTDSLDAIIILTKGVRRKRSQEKFSRYIEAWRAMQVPHIVVEFRHVGAHKGVRTKRNAVNTFCDMECSRYLKLERARRRALIPHRQEAVA